MFAFIKINLFIYFSSFNLYLRQTKFVRNYCKHIEKTLEKTREHKIFKNKKTKLKKLKKLKTNQNNKMFSSFQKQRSDIFKKINK